MPSALAVLLCTWANRKLLTHIFQTAGPASPHLFHKCQKLNVETRGNTLKKKLHYKAAVWSIEGGIKDVHPVYLKVFFLPFQNTQNQK